MSGITEYRLLPVGMLVPNDWNPNEMDIEDYEKARESIRQFGFVDPITVRELPDTMFQIIDGENRWNAAKDEGLNDVPCVVVDVGDEDAEQLTIVLNELRGRPNPAKLAALVKSLADRRPMADLERVLPFRRQQLAQMVADRRQSIDWDALHTKDEPPKEKKESWVERVYRLPDSSAKVIDEAIAKVRVLGARTLANPRGTFVSARPRKGCYLLALIAQDDKRRAPRLSRD